MHELNKFAQLLVEMARKHASDVVDQHKTDFGDVVQTAPNLLIRIRGHGLTLPASQFYFDYYYYPGCLGRAAGWYSTVPVGQLQVGDRVSLVCTDREYMVVGKLSLGA